MASRRPIHAWFLAALFCAAPVACLFTAEVPPGPCAGGNEDTCDDGNPCTTDLCQPDGFCSNDADDDLVPDDGNPCSDDTCVGGAEQHTSLADGTECGLTLSCEGGVCKCTSASECGNDEDCLKFACENEACKTINVPAGTFIDGADFEDCRQNACDGAGKLANVPDLEDFPIADLTPGDCMKKGCSADGKVVNVPNVADLPTGDVAGDCKKKGCGADGTPTESPDISDVPSDMTAGDCQKPGCDATGNLVTIDDSNDAPPNDNNPCTSEGCNGGTAFSNPVANGTSCGAAASCGPTGLGDSQTTAETCQGGVCAPAVTTTCGIYTCNGAVCNLTCTGNAQCTGGAFCQGGLCKTQTGLGTGCSMAAECSSGFCADGVCCNVACSGLCQSCTLTGQIGVCGSIPAGTDPDSECAGTQVCNAGECKKPTGDTCSLDLDCLTGQCEDGICCNVDCPGDCKKCNLTGSIGTCENVPSMQTAGACTNGSVCNGSGTCKKSNGQGCGGNSECLSGFCPNESGPDVCCDTACNNTCTSCFGTKTGGSDGTCGNVLNKTDPNNDCSGTCNGGNGDGCCNGNGVCNPP